jgi:hypothetical protein
MATPFGIDAIAFQDQSNDEILEGKDTLDEIRFMDQQFVLMICDDYKAVSLRKLSHLSFNVLYFETENQITWSLFMGEREQSSPVYPIQIGGIDSHN